MGIGKDLITALISTSGLRFSTVLSRSSLLSTSIPNSLLSLQFSPKSYHALSKSYWTADDRPLQPAHTGRTERVPLGTARPGAENSMSRFPRIESTTLNHHSPANEARLRRIQRALGVDSRPSLPSPTVKRDLLPRIEHSDGQGGQNKGPQDLVSIIERKRGAWSAADLAELLECSEKHIYALARSGRMPPPRIDGMIRFDPCTTAEWLRKYIVAA